MIYRTYGDAKTALICQFAPRVAAMHRVIRATRDGVPVGWMIQMITKGKVTR